MITFNTLIYQHEGQFFRFKRQDDQSLTCHSCQWHGGVVPETAGDNHHIVYRAFVEQKYPPYGRIWAADVLASEDEGMRWVAVELLKE